MRNTYSIVILSKNQDNVRACVGAIRQQQHRARIVVIDDGMPDTGCIGTTRPDPECWACMGRPLYLRQGIKPFVFARNANIGITLLGNDDVILLNDDALVETPHGFDVLQEAAYDPHYGLVSATTNLAGNPAQHRAGTDGVRVCPSPTPGNSFATVAFVCVYIPRRTIDSVGLLDERFTAYGWEDNDYCRRVAGAGLKIGIADGCFVDHSKLHSTFRGEAYAAGDINAGRKIYLEKWGTI